MVTGRNVARGEAVVAEIRAAGGVATFIRADLTVEDEARGLVREAAATFGPVTVLVNNAVAPEVVAADRKLLEVPPEVWQRMYEVNVIGLMQVTRALLLHCDGKGLSEVKWDESLCGNIGVRLDKPK